MTPTTDTPSFEVLLAALHDSHDRLAQAVGGLNAEQVAVTSYADEWSIAQVLSHLGSGAEIFDLFLAAGLAGDPAPGMETFQAVWARWDAKAPEDQVRDAVAADAQFLDGLEALSEPERTGWRMELFGAEQDLTDIARLRLGEHALHTWDVAVALDGGVTVPEDVAELLVDRLDSLVARSGKPTDTPVRVHVSTHGPDRVFTLAAGPDGVRLSPAAADSADHDASLRLPAEAFTRLVYGRMDADHTPSVDTQGIDLDTLRAMFPGF
jgi:uncharacterized protein (TIGR03083 family)